MHQDAVQKAVQRTVMLPEVMVKNLTLGNLPSNMQVLQFIRIKLFVRQHEQAQTEVDQYKCPDDQPSNRRWIKPLGSSVLRLVQ